MGVDDSGNDCGAVQIDDASRGAREYSGFGIGANEDDATIASRERCHDRARIVYGVDAAVGENEISGALRPEQDWCEHGRRKVA